MATSHIRTVSMSVRVALSPPVTFTKGGFMASKTLGPYIETAKKYITHVEYNAAAANKQHGPAVYCRLIVSDVPIIGGPFEGLGTAYCNPKDKYDRETGRRIAFERALRGVAPHIQMRAESERTRLEYSHENIEYGKTMLLRAITIANDALQIEHTFDKDYAGFVRFSISQLCHAGGLVLEHDRQNEQSLFTLDELIGG